MNTHALTAPYPFINRPLNILRRAKWKLTHNLFLRLSLIRNVKNWSEFMSFERGTLQLRMGGQLTIRNIHDIRIVDEVIFKDGYGLNKLGCVPTRIIDIGAHIGSFSFLAHRLFPNAEIIAIEPEADNFSLLKMNIGVDCRNEAVSDKEGTITLNVAKENGAQNSVTTDFGRGTLHSDTQEVSCYPLSHYGEADLIKVDCEGGEYDIFKEEVTKAKTILIELHDIGKGEKEALLERFKKQYRVIPLLDGRTWKLI